MKKENQRVAISKRLLKEALLRILKEKEIDKVSITELCQEAEINRATFYRHYNVPQDVLVDIERDLIEKAQDIAPLPTTVKGTKSYLEKLFTYIYDHADVIRLLIQSNAEANLVQMFDVCNLAILGTKNAVKEDSPLDKASLRLISSFLCGGGYYLVRAWLMEDIQKTPQEIAQLIYELISKDLEIYIIG